jgi:nicotinamidase-related amidase
VIWVRAVNAGKMYATIEEIVDPRHTAVVVVDMQRDFCHPEGAFGRHGFDLTDIQCALPNAIAVVDAARAAGAMVIWLMQTRLPEGLSDWPASQRMQMRYELPEVCADGSWGHALADGLRARPDEIVIRKHRSSGFAGTSLDMLLDANGVETLVVLGVATEGCVDSTARDAGVHNYYVVCVTDAMASSRRSLHEAAQTIMRARYDCLTAAELTGLWLGVAQPR